MYNRKDIYKIYEDANKRVEVNCDEAHNRSALKGCLRGKASKQSDPVSICILYEYILKLEGRLNNIVKAVEVE